tara:strand:- start:7097 stop:7942 length:846 start_codon:yes stop_codon:yes gene_type:complete
MSEKRFIPICTVVTENCYTEFLLFKKSIEQFHDCEWFISCDPYVKEKIEEGEKVHAHELIESDDCDHVINDSKQNDNFTKLILTKFNICTEGLSKHPFVLLIDSDMVFTNPIEDKILDLLESKSVDACVCPHMTDGFGDEKITGYFNCGMVFISNQDFVNHWATLTENHRQLGLYYEQKPLELVIKAFVTLNLPMHYNIGWWRFLTPQTQKRMDLFGILDQKIFFGAYPAVNFHLHTLKKLKYDNHGEFLKDFLLDTMSKCFSMNYTEILEEHERLKNEDL